MEILLGILATAAAAAIGFGVYIAASPMPAVRLLRRQMGEKPTVPEGFNDIEKSVETADNLVYPSEYKMNQYDLYLPREGDKLPLILWVHGGAFVAGDKEGTREWCVLLANKGYAVASMNYCYAPEASYPVPVRQVGEALNAIARLPHKGRIDMDKVFVAGDSAGAYIGVQFALAHTNKSLGEKLGVKSPLGDNALKGALLFCGPYDVKKFLSLKKPLLRFFVSRIGWSFLGRRNWKKAPLLSTVTPMDFVTENSAPCYITDGNTMSFESHGRALAKSLRDRGVYARERYFSEEEHGEIPHEYQMKLTTAEAQQCFLDVTEFLNMCLNGIKEE